MIKTMKEQGTTTANPIYHWSDNDIWEYARNENIELNPLYQCGYSRVGCIGCPLANYRIRTKEFNDFPKYKGLYIKAFDRMLETRRKKGLTEKVTWHNGYDVFDWWIEEYKHNVKGQITIDEYLKGAEE